MNTQHLTPRLPAPGIVEGLLRKADAGELDGLQFVFDPVQRVLLTAMIEDDRMIWWQLIPCPDEVVAGQMVARTKHVQGMVGNAWREALGLWKTND